MQPWWGDHGEARRDRGRGRADEALGAAREAAADVLLLGAAAGLARVGALDGFCGSVYVSERDLAAYGCAEVEAGVRLLDEAETARMLSGAQYLVIGRF